MPRRSVLHVHSILLQMIKQDFPVSLATPSPGAKPKIPLPKLNGVHGSAQRTNGRQYVWEVRHAGLLGIKYEVAVRTDLVRDNSVKLENEDDASSGKEVLRGIVDAAVLG